MYSCANELYVARFVLWANPLRPETPQRQASKELEAELQKMYTVSVTSLVLMNVTLSILLLRNSSQCTKYSSVYCLASYKCITIMHYIMDIFQLVWSIASCQLLTYSVYEQMEISLESPRNFSLLSWNIRFRRTLLAYRLFLRTQNLTYLLFLFKLLVRSLLQLEVNPWFKISVHNSETINIVSITSKIDHSLAVVDY